MPNAEIARLRLLAQGISGPRAGTPAEVVRSLGAMQAQDFPASLWAIGVRTKSATLVDIEAAVHEREIVRTWPMRGTLHWLPGEDLGWMVRLMAPRAVAKAAARTRQLEIDATVLSKARKALEGVLRGGGGISRPEAYALFSEQGLAPEGQRGIHILSLLSHEGVLCFGPHRGKQPTFVLVEEWLPKLRKLDGADALAELAGRYFRSHGPATVHDFAWWTGLTISTAREGLAAAQDKLESMTVEGKEYWLEPPKAPNADARAVHLLPGFDEFILGYTDRTAVLSPEQAKRLIPGKNGMFLAAMVSGAGEILGTWRRSVAKGAVTVTPEMFEDAPVPAGFEQAARRYAAFLGLPLR